jgi:hypothetical protein
MFSFIQQIAKFVILLGKSSEKFVFIPYACMLLLKHFPFSVPELLFLTTGKCNMQSYNIGENLQQRTYIESSWHSVTDVYRVLSMFASVLRSRSFV